MKTTLEITDGLFARAKVHAKRTGQPLRALVEEGLRLVIDRPATPTPYRLRMDLAVAAAHVGESAHPFAQMAPDGITPLMYGTDLEEVERIMGRGYVERYVLPPGPPKSTKRRKPRR